MTNICGHSATRNQRFRLFCLEIISVDKKTALIMPIQIVILNNEGIKVIIDKAG
jgi:hypothetical protein